MKHGWLLTCAEGELAYKTVAGVGEREKWSDAWAFEVLLYKIFGGFVIDMFFCVLVCHRRSVLGGPLEWNKWVPQWHPCKEGMVDGGVVYWWGWGPVLFFGWRAELQRLVCVFIQCVCVVVFIVGGWRQTGVLGEWVVTINWCGVEETWQVLKLGGEWSVWQTSSVGRE